MKPLLFKNIKSDLYFHKIIFVFLLGFLVRLFVCKYTYIVNPDGALYIHQARAMYYGLWDSLTSCALSYLSNYPIFIVGAYTIFHDWIIAARSVSFFFGSLTLIPIYFLLKRFFDEDISALGTLVFALIPTFVRSSADVVRGPIYWFFLTLGLCLFVSQIGKNRYRLYLILSCLSFLMAAWARIEAVLFIALSCFYILTIKQEMRIQKLVFFIMPVVLAVLLSMIAFMFVNAPVKDIFRVHEVLEKFYAPLIEYRSLRANLSELVNNTQQGILKFFLHKARNLVWFIGFGTLISYVVKAFFYPFFFIFILGIAGIKSKIKEDNGILYLVFLSLSTVILLYFHVLHTWIMENRFFALFIFPCCIFIGFGLQKITSFLQSRFNLKASMVFSIVSLLILISALPKDLKPREKDKLVFKEIGETIAKREGNIHKIAVATSPHSIRWISFYANLKHKGAPCPQKFSDLERLAGKSYRQFIRNLKKHGIKYFLWEERHWPKNKFDLIKSLNQEDLIVVGHWSHPDTGRMVLLKVNWGKG